MTTQTTNHRPFWCGMCGLKHERSIPLSGPKPDVRPGARQIFVCARCLSANMIQPAELALVIPSEKLNVKVLNQIERLKAAARAES